MFFKASLFILLFVISCSENPDNENWNNPYDPKGTNYYPPSLLFLDSILYIAAKDTLFVEVLAKDSNGLVKQIEFAKDTLSFTDTLLALQNIPLTRRYKDHFPLDSFPSDSAKNTDTTIVGDFFMTNDSIDTLLKSGWKFVFADTGNFILHSRALDDHGIYSLLDSILIKVRDSIPFALADAGSDTLVAVSSLLTLGDSLNNTGLKYIWDCKGLAKSDTLSSSLYTVTTPTMPDPNWYCILLSINTKEEEALDTVNISVRYLYADSLSPQGEINNFWNVTFAWQPGVYRSDYQLWLGDSGGALSKIKTTSDYFTKLDTFSMDHAYSWSILSFSADGDSAWSDTLNFKTGSPEGMVKLAAGSFSMGNRFGDPDEDPVTSVSISGFWMDTLEVSQGDWSEFSSDFNEFNPGCDDCPITLINWYSAIQYANYMSKENQLDTIYSWSGTCDTCSDNFVLENVQIDFNTAGFRLPNEAEWEYAARAGTSTEYYWGSDTINMGLNVWWNDTITSVSGNKLPNTWGLYDMIGNVWEWNNDWYSDYPGGSVADYYGTDSTSLYKVYRGGSWSESDTSVFRTSNRQIGRPRESFPRVGFRLILIEP